MFWTVVVLNVVVGLIISAMSLYAWVYTFGWLSFGLVVLGGCIPTAMMWWQILKERA